MIGWFLGEHLHGRGLHAVPEGVEGSLHVVYHQHVARLGVEADIQLAHVVAYRWQRAGEVGALAGKLVGVAVLSGQHDELVFARVQIHVHAIVGVGQGREVGRVLLALRLDELALLVEYQHVHSSYVVIEHVGPLQVVIILELQVEPRGAVLAVFFHHVACRERG